MVGEYAGNNTLEEVIHMLSEVDSVSEAVRPEELTTEVDALLDPGEPDGVFRDSPRSAGAALLLASPPTPRPKRQD